MENNCHIPDFEQTFLYLEHIGINLHGFITNQTFHLCAFSVVSKCVIDYTGTWISNIYTGHLFHALHNENIFFFSIHSKF